MSDLEDVNVMLGNYPGIRSYEELNGNIEINSRSNGTRTDMARKCDDFRSVAASWVLWACSARVKRKIKKQPERQTQFDETQ